MIDWYVRAESFGTCNCDHWCPCQFEGDPTHYSCQGMDAFRVLQGHFGDVDLTGVVAASIFSFPGPVYKGGGRRRIFVDHAASPEQVDAIERLMRGEETVEASNIWWVFHAMSEDYPKAEVVPITFEVDIDARQGRIEIPGVATCDGEPIRNPRDGQVHRVQIGHPEGIEFDFAEIGNARTETTGPIALKLENTYAQFNYLEFNQYGRVDLQS